MTMMYAMNARLLQLSDEQGLIIVDMYKFLGLLQGWRTYLMSRSAWIVHYRWWAAKINWFYSNILFLAKCEEEWLLLNHEVSAYRGASF